ncbi:MAG: hypothetical protein HQL84_00645 [Magnetococcales bacterium]|nr:hypothetical protein [Magnetococcales bacterium]MBF0148536.1 hypothetical protein [Magnetococcales bacterium]MBF0629770.1 hypothetical protein [Magnetococcales bacterium]
MKRRNDRLVALVILGMVALNFPILSLFSREGVVFGIPLLFFYLFGFWLLFVLMIAMIVTRKSGEKP